MAGIVQCYKCSARYWSTGYRCQHCGAFQPLASPKRFYALLAVTLGPNLLLIALVVTFVDLSNAINFLRGTVPGDSIRARFVAELGDCRSTSALIEASGRAGFGGRGAADIDGSEFNGTRYAGASYRTPSEQDCLRDRQCWEPYKFNKASKICSLEVQQYVALKIDDEELPDARIVDFQAPNFTRYLRHTKTGVCTYIGGNLEIQNLHGDWEKTIYSCDFDAAANEVVGIRLETGDLL